MGRPGASAFMNARFRSRRSPATTARRSGNPRHGAGVSAPITALGRSSGGGAGLASTGVAGVVTGSALRELPTAAGGPRRTGSAAHSAAARPPCPAAGGRPVTALPGRCTLMEHLWLPGIALPAREPACGADAPVGLDESEDLTASGAQPTRLGSYAGALRTAPRTPPSWVVGLGGAAAAPGDQAVGPDQQGSPDPMPWAAAPSAGASATPKR
jgi:hypothetical protein